ncbi:Cloroperoxidase [Peniophora sp. CONT]|nr:Cloroperoxidase [Peniophora sp. CONT]
MSTPTESHAFQPAGPSSSRSPCPALNSLANHGYLNRDGRAITVPELVRAMNEVYHVSVPLGSILATVGAVWCGSGWSLDLEDLAAHNKIEHDASLTHDDARATDKYAPIPPNPELVKQFLAVTGKSYLTLDDLVKYRAQRDGTLSRPLSSVHNIIAVGELALTQQAFENVEGHLSKEYLHAWYGEEKLPAGWGVPQGKVLGLLSTSKLNKRIQDAVAKIEKSK